MLRTVILPAAVAGAISFAVGFIAPVFLSNSNLGPLLGVFVTGPLGAIAGALWGIVRVARRSDGARIGALLQVLFGAWVLTMLYTFLIISLSAKLTIAAIALQLIVTAAALLFLYHPEISSKLSEPVRRCRPGVIAAMILIAAMTAFPPVTSGSGARGAQAVPRIAFLLDGRLDSSRHQPLLAVHKSTLVLEWLCVTLLLAGAAIVLTNVNRRQLFRG